MMLEPEDRVPTSPRREAAWMVATVPLGLIVLGGLLLL